MSLSTIVSRVFFEECVHCSEKYKLHWELGAILERSPLKRGDFAVFIASSLKIHSVCRYRENEFKYTNV